MKKIYRLYRKITVYDHFSIQSIHFCLDAIQLFSYDGFCFGSQQQCYKEVVCVLGQDSMVRCSDVPIFRVDMVINPCPAVPR